MLPAILLALACAAPAEASPLTYVSDLLTEPLGSDPSAPSSPAEHTITFTLAHAIPASGSIVITPQDGAFSIPAGFDYTDADFAVWDGSAYVNRTLAAVPSATDDGVSVVTGSSGSLTLTLSSGAGLAADSKVEVLLGTNASFGATSTQSITNPSAEGSYRIGIQTFDASSVLLDDGTAMIAVVKPVSLVLSPLNTAPTRFNGFPSGTIAANNSVVELSLQTDGPATCRYSTTPNTPYDSMADQFAPSLGTLFTSVVSGLQNGTAYVYYVRCKSLQGAINADDFLISFQLDVTPISNTSVTQSGGVFGSGPYQNGSQNLYLAGLTISGIAAPQSSVTILQDGSQAAVTQSDAGGNFKVALPSLERGTYTFAVYATTNGVKSSFYTATLSIETATNNTLSNIMLPPTVSLQNDSVGLGDSVVILGRTVPGATSTVTINPSGTTAGAPQTYIATSSGSGTWQVTLAPGALGQGTYTITAHTVLGTLQSNESAPAYLGVGQTPGAHPKSGADLNGDGRVNLVDFSILLTAWGTSNPLDDLNGDGTVNLADFSIMLFNWTG